MNKVLLLLVTCLAHSYGEKILGIFPVAGKSHYVAGLTLMKILADRGHEVVMVTPFVDKKPPKNLRMVTLEPLSKEKFDVDFFSFNLHPLLQLYIYNSMGEHLVNATISHPKFKSLLNSGEKFDLIILEEFFSDSLKYTSVLLDAPLVLFSAMGASSMTNPSVANPAPPSYVSDPVCSKTRGLSLFDRIDRSFQYLVSEFCRNFILIPGQDRLVKENFPGAPDISEYYHKASLVLLNGDVSIHDPVPKVPGMVDIGGFHIEKPKPIPKDLLEILDNAKHGVIYFSLGSNIKSADMPKETLTGILRVFSKLKETVLWKWEDDELPGKPDNVFVRKWLPQNDIFAHKNIKVFITHGGIFSTMEAVYHGIPCLSLPIFGDQILNSIKATDDGYAKWFTFNEFTEEIFHSSLLELLENPKYTKVVKKRSEIMHDQLVSPREKLVFWVEYAMRHKGADHLKVAALNLNWYQYLLLDVIAFLTLCTLSLVLILRYSVRYLLRKLRNSSEKKKRQ